jgi:hypothetical protein
MYWRNVAAEEAKAEEEKAEVRREAAMEELPKSANIEAYPAKEEQPKAEEAESEPLGAVALKQDSKQ